MRNPLQAHFNVYAVQEDKKPWGFFTGQPYNAPSNDSIQKSKSKVSTIHGEPWDTVLLARLRFKPDVSEPTLK
jgi:hypothetical protein